VATLPFDKLRAPRVHRGVKGPPYLSPMSLSTLSSSRHSDFTRT
jgi:hypothetical protein